MPRYTRSRKVKCTKCGYEMPRVGLLIQDRATPVCPECGNDSFYELDEIVTCTWG